MVALRILASGSTTATVGIAWLSVHSRNLALESSRSRIPVTTTSSAAITATTPKMPNFRGETRELFSVGIWHLRRGCRFRALLFVYLTENQAHKRQRRVPRHEHHAHHVISDP